VTAKKRKTIMANPLDDIEITVKPLQKKNKKTSAPSKNVEKSASIAVKRPRKASAESSNASSTISDENILIVEESSIKKKADHLNNKSSSSHEFKSLSAEEIFMEESGSRQLIIRPLSTELRRIKANKCVILWSWVSVPTSLIPFVVVDVAATIAIQVKMIKDICNIYNIPFENENARAFISGLVGGGVATIASSGLKNMLLKSLPHIGGAVAFLAQPALGFSTTYALGQVFIRHLENDGVLSDFDSEKMREVFRDQLDRGKTLYKRGRPS
jgi:uncharacterized protein (DUF697 family)